MFNLYRSVRIIDVVIAMNVLVVEYLTLVA